MTLDSMSPRSCGSTDGKLLLGNVTMASRLQTQAACSVIESKSMASKGPVRKLPAWIAAAKRVGHAAVCIKAYLRLQEGVARKQKSVASPAQLE